MGGIGEPKEDECESGGHDQGTPDHGNETNRSPKHCHWWRLMSDNCGADVAQDHSHCWPDCCGESSGDQPSCRTEGHANCFRPSSTWICQ